MEPGTVLVPAIGAYSHVEESGSFDSRDNLVLPTDPKVLARWTKSSPMVAKEGNTLLAGHVVYNNDNGSLFRIGTLSPGDRAYTKDSSGNVQEFVLVRLTSVTKDALPGWVWKSDGSRQLTIVTCGGPITETSTGRHYRDNIIAVFVPA